MLAAAGSGPPGPGGHPDAVSRAVLAARAGGRARAERRQGALR